MNLTEVTGDKAHSLLITAPIQNRNSPVSLQRFTASHLKRCHFHKRTNDGIYHKFKMTEINFKRFEFFTFSFRKNDGSMQTFQTLHMYIGSAYNLSCNHYLIGFTVESIYRGKKQQLSFFFFVCLGTELTQSNKVDR